jgi:hypothetical protein
MPFMIYMDSDPHQHQEDKSLEISTKILAAYLQDEIVKESE